MHPSPLHVHTTHLADEISPLQLAPACQLPHATAPAGKLFHSAGKMEHPPAARADQRGKTILVMLRGSSLAYDGSVHVLHT